MKTIEEEMTGMQAMNELSNELVATRTANLEAVNSMISRVHATQMLLDQVRYMLSRSVLRVKLPPQVKPYREEPEFLGLLAAFGLEIVDCPQYRTEFDIAVIGGDEALAVGDRLSMETIPRSNDFVVNPSPVAATDSDCCGKSKPPKDPYPDFQDGANIRRGAPVRFG